MEGGLFLCSIGGSIKVSFPLLGFSWLDLNSGCLGLTGGGGGLVCGGGLRAGIALGRGLGAGIGLGGGLRVGIGLRGGLGVGIGEGLLHV